MAAIPADPAPLDSNDSKGHQQPSERVSICEEQRPQHESLEMPTQISPIASTSIKSRVVVPPINFSLVAPGIHRSGHPNKKNFSFLRRLKLKSIMYVEGSEEYRKDSMDFVVEEGIELFRYDLSKEDVSPRFVLVQPLCHRSESVADGWSRRYSPSPEEPPSYPPFKWFSIRPTTRC